MSTTVDPLLIEAFEAAVSVDPSVDRHAVFTRLRAESPVFYSERLEAWVLTRFDDIRAVLSDPNRFASLTKGAGAPVFGRSFLQMAGREHNKKVGIVAREMRTPRALRDRLEGLVEKIAIEQAASLPLDEPIDLRERYTIWIPLLAITELTQVNEAAKFRDWYRAMVAGGVSSISNPGAREAGLRARAELGEYLAPIIEERRRNPGNDLVSDLVQAEYDGEPLPEEEIVSTVAFLLTAGIETTEKVLTSTFTHLALNREQWHAIRARRHDRNALSAFSAEALRMYPPVHGLTRSPLEPVVIRDAEIAEGEKIALLLASANRDEDHFVDPHRFDVDRFIDQPDRQFTGTSDILPFGAGTHHCTGSRLAQTEMIHAFQKLLDRIAWMEPAGELPANEGFMLHGPPSLPVILHPA